METSRLTEAQIQTQAAKRTKGNGGVRKWMVVTASGVVPRVEEVGKHSIMRRTGLPARDLRALDPVLSYPSSILGRERAIVVNLEHIKAIVTANEVLLLNFHIPLVGQFVNDLLHRISHVGAQQAAEGYGVGLRGGAAERDDLSPIVDLNTNLYTGLKVLPFEFKALEACLESACKCLESETRTLEDQAYPALDELTSKISTHNLERVRQIKSRLVMLSGRVQKVRDELEHLLDDDNDMAEMYLTEKLGLSDEQTSVRGQDETSEPDEEERVDESASGDNSDSVLVSKPNVEELEMLLEAYFAQIDGILRKLSDMREDVDDTEDYINILLDDKQNQLLEMGVMLSAATMIINAGIVVFGIFGMNIDIELFHGVPRQFWATTIGTCVGCVALYLMAVGWGMKKKLLAI